VTPLAAPILIDTPRLHVRPVRESDLPDLLEVNGDPEVTRFLPYATWSSLDDARAWLERMNAITATGTGQQLVVVQVRDRRAIGTLLLFRLEAASRRIELGYALGRRHWGQGLMREAVTAACDHAFGPLGLHRIEAEVDPGNVPSNRLLAGVGFVLEGRLRQRWIDRGAAHDTNIYGLLAADWRSAPALA
jgi:[ribosomal protein S5]-alanine N-acetyltransferase